MIHPYEYNFSYRLSKPILSLNFSMMGSVPPLNRPPAPKSPPRDPDSADDGSPCAMLSMRWIIKVMDYCLGGDASGSVL